MDILEVPQRQLTAGLAAVRVRDFKVGAKNNVAGTSATRVPLTDKAPCKA
jgi:hypothetical protein